MRRLEGDRVVHGDEFTSIQRLQVSGSIWGARSMTHGLWLLFDQRHLIWNLAFRLMDRCQIGADLRILEVYSHAKK